MFEQFKVPDLLPAAPELFIAGMAMVILVADLFTKDKRRLLAFVLAELTLLGCLMLQVSVADGAAPDTFSKMFVNDAMSNLLKEVLYPTVMVVLFYARDYVAERDPMAKGEFYVLALFATLGMMVMISANHFLTVYVGLELLSLSLYAMVAMNRDSVASTEAAMKYFILGALASGLLLYGMSMIYGGIGSLSISDIFHCLKSKNDMAGNPLNQTLLVLGLVFVVAGISFKLGVVPFHMWIPDVYHGAPTAVTLFIASAPKLAGFAIAMRLLPNGLAYRLAEDWQGMLMILAVASMAIGNLAAIAQTNLKRMLAYSAISHMGFMLLGLTTGLKVMPEGGLNYELAVDAYASSLFYVVAYVIMSLASFGMILLLARSGFESDRIEDLKGLNKRSPWFAGMMLMVMFSMAGIPFFVGFFAKFAVLQSAIRAGYLWLAIAAIIFSLIGAFYYLRVVKVMYFDAPSDNTALAAPLDMRLMLSVNALAIALFGLFPHRLSSLCNAAITQSLLVLMPG